MKFCAASPLRRFHVLCDRSEFGVVALSLWKAVLAMTQLELNHEIARQTGESVAEIARHGFTILTEFPDDSDDELPTADVVATTVED